MKLYLSTAHAAEMLGVSYDTFTRKIATRLTRYRLTGDHGRYSYSIAELTQFAKEHAIHPSTEKRKNRGAERLAKKLKANPLSRQLLERMGGNNAA